MAVDAHYLLQKETLCGIKIVFALFDTISLKIILWSSPIMCLIFVHFLLYNKPKLNFCKEKNQWSFFVNTLIPYVQKMEKIFANPWWLRKFCWPSLFLLMRCEKIQCKNRKNHHVKIFDLLKKIKTPLPNRTVLYCSKNCFHNLKKKKNPQISQEDAIFPKNPEIIIFCLIFLGPTKVKESLT